MVRRPRLLRRFVAVVRSDPSGVGAGFVALSSGRGLIVGGNNQIGMPFIDEAAIYDLAADTWTPIEPLATARYSHAVVALADGSVLVVGGRGPAGALDSVERSE